MRLFSDVVQLAPGQHWPDAENGFPSPPFRWALIENRGVLGSGCDLLVSVGTRVSNDLATSGYDYRVPAGYYVIRNFAGHKDPGDDQAVGPSELSILNVGAASVPVFIELDDELMEQKTLPIVSTGASSSLPQTQVASGATTLAGGAISASIPAVVGKTSYITGFDVTLGIAAAAATVTVTVTGLPTTLSFEVVASTTQPGALVRNFPTAIAASAPDTAVTVSLPAVGGVAALNAVNVYGYQQ